MSCVETPQKNGVVVRKHQHILNIIRTLIFQSNLPKLFWNFAASHAVFLLNRLPSKVLHNKIPYDILYGSSSDLTFIKVFGCEAFASTLAHNRTKLDPRARRCVYLGRRLGIKGSLLYDLHIRKVFLSKNVSFNENSFPFKHIINHTNSENFVMPHFPHYQDTDHSFLTSSMPLQNQQTPYIVPQENYSSLTFTAPDNPHDNPVPIVIRKSTRCTEPPTYLKDFHCNVAVGIESKNSSLVKYPISSFVNYSKFSDNHKHFAFSISSIVERKTYAQVVKNENYRKARDDEINALVQTGTWEFGNLQIGKQTVGYKWVYKTKHKADGLIERFKARLVAKGFTQQEGIDFR